MRVLFWAELFWPHIGGSELGALELILALRERGHEFVVVARQDDPSERPIDQYEGVPIYRLPFWKAFADRNLEQLHDTRKRFARLRETFAPDLVHLHCLGPTALFFLESSKNFSTPLLVTLTGMAFEKECGLQLFERVLRLSNWVTGKSKAILHRAHHIVPGIEHRSSVIYRGRKDLFREPSSSPPPGRRIVCVGRLAKEKGFDLAVSAFACIALRYPDLEMVIAGDGPERSPLEKQTESLGLSEKVKWLGWIAPANVQALLATSQLVLVPSRWEGLPRVAVEAALMARPVIGTKVGGIPELIVHGETGLLTEAENEEALVQAIMFVLDHPERAFVMGQNARRLALEQFNLERCIDSYENLYNQLTRKNIGKGQCVES